jgi:SAP domain-containing ribonucleoprotein
MADYSQLKVNELKEILKERGLPLSGTKKEIIARLETDDSSKAETEGDKTVESSNGAAAIGNSEKTVDQPNEVTEQESTESTGKAEACGTDVAEDVAARAPNNGASEANNEDKTAEVIADLEKKIARAKRFGNEDTESERRLARIKKFGLSSVPSALTAAAKVSKPLSSKGKKAAQAPAAAPTAAAEVAISAEEEEKRRRRRERFATSSA